MSGVMRIEDMPDGCVACDSRDAFDCSTAGKGTFCRCGCHGGEDRRECYLCNEEADHKVDNGTYVHHGVVHDRTLLLCQSHKDRFDRMGDES